MFKKVVEVPLSVDPVVGRGKTLLEIQKHLQDDVSRVIGIYGMGGVGKTTILKKINNDLATAGQHGFDVVIFVTISKNPDVSLIQREIGDRLGLTLPAGNDQGTRRVQCLYQALSEKKFLLLLDDVWEKLDFESIGIPIPAGSPKGGKVVIATRSKQVCVDMEARKGVEVSVLNETESWNLFCSNLHPDVPLTSDPVVEDLVRVVVRKCGGLPLALVIVARAMSNANEHEWRRAATKLRESQNTTQDVLSIIKFSIDSLKDDFTRECLLYCALFPEDYSIKIDQLIEYWLGEGFLDNSRTDSSTLRSALGDGHSIIRTLKNACLLEEGDVKDKHVKMHDMVRETALWLTGNDFDWRNRFIVCEGDEFERISQLHEWESARRISLMRQEVVELPSPVSECPNLLTLLVAAKPLGSRQEPVVVPPTMFAPMSVLRVLDLSRTNIMEIPREVGLLSELRYLNLSWTKIRALPEELGRLLKLRHLGLWGTIELQHIPREAIVSLTRLQRLFLYRSGYSVSFSNDVSSGISWGDLNSNLRRLEEFSVDIHNTPSLDLLAASSRLAMCIKGLRLVGISDLSSSLLSSALEQLVNMEWLSIEDCHQLEVLKITGGRSKLRNLTYLGLTRLRQLSNVIVEGEPFKRSYLFPRIDHLELNGCDRLKDVVWLRQLPFLEKLLLWSCKEVKVLLPPLQAAAGSSSTSFLPKLKYMALVNLPAFMLISNESLVVPSFELLWVSRCPFLRKLPFTDKRNCEKIREIFGSQEWWDSLEWEGDNGESTIVDPAANQVTTSLFRSTLHEVFREIASSSSPAEVDDACRRKFLA
ncbi:hypothetical protein Taro_036335 [Colocasia esculenta]|uniref:AAA+ ATPase domain-containing protein n=1 Tax=Colocasia esculenta TaxID=4460 RepID=A0A843W858_COLES|nr:hypothetical protein [Colocasia esculenta]